MSEATVTTYCPTCGKAFRVPKDVVGKKIVCKSCQTQFVVQAEKPGIPTAHAPATPAAPAAPAAPAHHAPHPPGTASVTTQASSPPAVATALKAPTAAPSNPPVTAATTAPAPAPQVVDELAPIPFDDSPATTSVQVSAEAPTVSVARSTSLEKVKIESKGPYFVVKLVTAGKMVHVNIENSLNEHAADGWKLEQVLLVGSDAYAILSRFPQAAAENH